MQAHRVTIVGVTLIVGMWEMVGPRAYAAENLVGHTASVTKFSGQPPVGIKYKIAIKAAKNGNPDAFPLPLDPISNGGLVSIGRDGGAVHDPLTAGMWIGIGKPPGSKGWKYKNKSAPVSGPVSVLVSRKGISLVAKATGAIPVPSASNGVIQTLIVVDDQTYCAEAAAPHAKEVAGIKIQSKDQGAPAACPSCVPGADTDEDRIDDCYETDTGVFQSATDTGTDPYDPDTDNDQLSDGDEVLGSTAGLDLPGMGTNPLRKDILLEYDWFDDSLDCGAHSHQPTANSLASVSAAFAAAPVINPDGTTGINVIHDRGQGGAFTGGNFILDADGVFTGDVNSAEFRDYKAVNFATNRNGYFHYVILPHRYNTDSFSSGFAEVYGDDLVVSLYCANSDQNVANTIMHELGHNLGLFHGGSDNCNYKPNYNSVMNYLFQFSGIDTDCDPIGDGLLSYSTGSRIVLNENNLDENAGTCGSPGWDWNGNHVIESSISTNINENGEDEIFWCSGTKTTLRDSDDWGHLFFGGLSEADGAPVVSSRFIECDNPAPLD